MSRAISMAIVVLLVLSLVPLSLRAQNEVNHPINPSSNNPAVMPAKISKDVQADTSTRTIPVSVFQMGSPKEPLPISDLTAADFELRVRGTPPVRAASFRRGLTRMVILFDVGRNQTQSEWKTAVAISTRLAENLPDGSELNLVSFSDRVEQVVSTGTDRRKLIDILHGLGPTSKDSNEGALLAALERGAQLLEPARLGDVEVFFLNAPVTGTRSGQKEDAIGSQFSGSGVRALGIVLDDPGMRSPGLSTPTAATVTDHPELFSASERLAVATGGMFVSFRPDASEQVSSRQQENVASLINALATNYYSLTVDCSSLRRAERAQVKLKNKKLAATSFLSYPTMLYPCAGH